MNFRYKGTEEVVENIVIDAIKDQLNRRQATEGISKHFLKFLCAMCGITEVRLVHY
jgi:integrator complex subunit 1